MRTWHKFWRLGRLEKRLLVESLLLLPLTALGVRSLGYRRCKSILMRMTRNTEDDLIIKDRSKFLKAHLTNDVVKKAAWHGIYRANCLEQSLVLWWLLRRQGIESDLRIGVRKGDRFEAHAWVEIAGVPLNESGDVHERFSTLAPAILSAEGNQ